MGEMGDKNMFLDSVFAEGDGESFLVSSSVYADISSNLKSTLFSRGRRTESFFTEDSKLYITPQEKRQIDAGLTLKRNPFLFDGASAKIVSEYRKYRPMEQDYLYRKLARKYTEMHEALIQIPENFLNRISFTKLWNFSVVGAIIVGMVSMTFIYRYLGMGANAEEDTQKVLTNAPIEQVLGDESVKSDEETVKYIQQIMQNNDEAKKEEFAAEVTKMVKGYPIEKMLPYILEQDRTVVAFLIGIAKKESGWGEHVPVYQGEDCFNYWGYRGPNPVGSGGHSCFVSREAAVETVAKRIQFLVEEKKLDTPAKMSIWKCGSECDKDGQVTKWISDVSMYFEKLN
jgi:hypothetical protein